MGLTEIEWEAMHPHHAQACIDSWTEKQKREDYRCAAVQHTIAITGGLKANGKPIPFVDFLPAYAKPENPDPTGEIALMAECDAALAKQNQNG